MNPNPSEVQDTTEITCKECDRTFVSRAQLETHTKWRHGELHVSEVMTGYIKYHFDKSDGRSVDGHLSVTSENLNGALDVLGISADALTPDRSNNIPVDDKAGDKEKFIRVGGFNDDYLHITYPVKPSAIRNLLEEAFTHHESGGEMRTVTVDVVEMTQDEFDGLEDVS